MGSWCRSFCLPWDYNCGVYDVPDLEAGESADVPVWMLGDHTVPDERVRELKRGDRSIRGWIVYPDDTVTLEKRFPRERR